MERQAENKTRQVMENIKANIFSTVFLIILGALLLLTYYLLKDYLNVLCFSFISAIAIKPMKDYILYEIILSKKDGIKKNIFDQNYLVKLFKGLYLLATDFKKNIHGVWQLIVFVWDSVKHFRADIYSLLLLTLVYILVFKIGVTLSLIIIGSLLLLDLLVRLVIYTYRRIFNLKGQDQQLQEANHALLLEEQQALLLEQETPISPLTKRNKKNSSKQQQKGQINSDQTSTTTAEREEAQKKKRIAEQEEENFYNSIVSTICVVGFVSTVVFILVSFGGLCLWDIIDMRNKVTITLQKQLKGVNQYLEQEGIKSYLDEAFIKDQILSQVDKLDTYINQSNLLPAIQVFQGVVNTYFNNTNSTMEEIEATQSFRVKIDECQQQYQKYINSSYIPSFIINSANELTAVVCYIQIFITQMDFNINEILNNLKNVGGNLYQNVQKMVVWIIQSLFTFLFSIIDYFLQTIIYLTSLYYLLSSPQFTLSKLLLLLPLEGEIKNKLETSLEKNIRGVFACTLKISFYHIILTWLMLDIFDLPFSFITSILAGIIAILPIVPVYCITIPYCIYLYFSNSIIEMIVLFVGYLHISLFSIDAIYSKNIAVHPFITGICVAMGMSVFDLKGIIIGPLIVCSVYLLVDVLGQIQETKKIDLIKKPSNLKRIVSNKQTKTESQQVEEEVVVPTNTTVQDKLSTQENKSKRKESGNVTIEEIPKPKQEVIKISSQPLKEADSSINKRNTRSRSKKND